MQVATHAAVTAFALAVLLLTPPNWMTPVLAAVVAFNILVEIAVIHRHWSHPRNRKD